MTDKEKRRPRSQAMYGASRHIEEAVAAGRHREVIGGAWDEIGQLQLDFLKAQGLTPGHRLLDIGCGSLRFGVHAVGYLEPGRYWGTDLHPALLEAGYQRELADRGLTDRLPRDQLIEDGEFTFSGIPETVDYAIATSVFTHLPFNQLRLCLHRLERHLSAGCLFYFSVFLATEGASVTEDVVHQPGGRTTQSHTDPYHYLLEDVVYAAKYTAWDIELIGDWGHPRGQMMVKASLPPA